MQHRPYSRTDRYGHELQKLLGDIFLKELDTSKVGFVTVRKVVVTRDLKLAKIYLSSISKQHSPHDVINYFEKHRKFVRKCVGNHITNKSVPDLKFFYDDSYREAEKIDRIFSKIHDSEEK